MSCYLFENWMTEPLMCAFDERVSDARSALHGWSDAEVRSAERYSRRLAKIARTRRGAQKLEARPHLFSRITEAQRLAVNILRLVATGIDDEADRALVAEEHARLCAIQSAQAAKRAAEDTAAPDVEIAKRHRASQAKKASKTRGKRDDGRTMRDLIAGLARRHRHPRLEAHDLWPHLRGEIEQWADRCYVKSKAEPDDLYEYWFGDKRRSIGYGQFRKVLRSVRKEESGI